MNATGILRQRFSEGRVAKRFDPREHPRDGTGKFSRVPGVGGRGPGWGEDALAERYPDGLFHFTTSKAADLIAGGGLSPSEDGMYGTGVYLTPDPTGSRIGKADFLDVRLKIETDIADDEIIEFRSILDMPDADDPSRTLRREGYAAVIKRNATKADEIVILDPSRVRVSGRGPA